MIDSFVPMENLIRKYNVPGPRYTSYPTVPFWEPEAHTEQQWKQSINNGFWRSGKEVSIYIHLPFCESLCTYCGCTTRITKNHAVENKYIKYVLKEWRLYLDTFKSRPIIKEVHLGGGTPTFFSPENLQHLISGILQTGELAENFELGFEGHPNSTTEEHLITLSALGFKRISLGIQDFDPEVQRTINRTQTYDQVRKVTELARKHGFVSINFDLIYGLPKQTMQSLTKTIEQTVSLSPSRIAFYGYAHIPWIKAAQTSFEQYLATPEERSNLYQLGKKLFKSYGYNDIGMDHFATSDDRLYQAYDQGMLHRNFMGYTTQDTDLLVGLGMSAISDSWTAFSQNEKLISQYYKRLDHNEFPIMKGHQLTHEDLLIRKHILNLMCKFKTRWSASELLEIGVGFNVSLLNDLALDGLITWDEHGVDVTEIGKPFIRNICMALDTRLWMHQKTNRFSQTL